MAVYKPSNCTPFLGAIDLTKPQYFRCEVNTSNTPVKAYKLQITDSVNNVIFEGDNWTNLTVPVLNGSLFDIQVIATGAPVSGNANPNVIYFYNNRWYKSDGITEVVNFYNDYPNQPYKWRIILNQNPSGQQLTDSYYDMIVATGEVIGSVPNRIQSYLSEYIYKDYWIQLCSRAFAEDDDDETKAQAFVGERVPVLRYDNSFGYLYPREGMFSQEDIDAAMYFQIYEQSNNEEYITRENIVDYATTIALSDATPFGVGKTAQFTKNGNYYTQTYTGVNNDVAASFKPLIRYYDQGYTGDDELLSDSTRLLVKNESSADSDTGVSSSPANGVFVYVDTTVEAEEEGAPNTSTVTVRWQRATDSNSWASLMGRVLYVKGGSSSGLNFESSAQAYGVIDSTPVSFALEKPVELYPNESNWADKNFGIVLKNSQTTTYIRPFSGLVDGMVLRLYQQVNNTNRDIIITSHDPEVWSITHGTLSTPLVSGEKYQIVSGLKSSDENPFYAYSAPVVTIEADWEDGEGGWKIYRKRQINATGTFTQEQRKHWRSFEWVLYDIDMGVSRGSGEIFEGEIRASFDGLEDGHRYDLQLAIEDEFGNETTTSIAFVAEIETSPSGLPAEFLFNCESQSVGINLAYSGKIIPDPPHDSSSSVNEGLYYEEGSVTIQNRNSELPEDGVIYDKTLLGDNIKGDISGPDTNDITVNTHHKAIDGAFWGDLFDVYVTSDTINNYERRIKIYAALPQEVTVDETKGLTDANPNRNKIEVGCVLQTRLVGTDEWIDTQEAQEDIGFAELIGTGLPAPEGGGKVTYKWQEDNNNIVYAYNTTGDAYNDSCNYLDTQVAHIRPLGQNGEPEDGEVANAINLYFTDYYSDSATPIVFPVRDEAEGQRQVTYRVLSDDGSLLVFRVKNAETGGTPLNYVVFSSEGVPTMWSDLKLYCGVQYDDSYANYALTAGTKEEKYSIWNDEGASAGAFASWDDNTVKGAYVQPKININAEQQHSERKNITAYEFILNVAVEQFDSNEQSIGTRRSLVRRCFVKKVNNNE